MSRLRPSPPIRPCLGLGRDDSSKKPAHNTRKYSEKTFEEDALILRVIEAYCMSAKTRYTVNSVDLGHLSRGNVLHDPVTHTVLQPHCTNCNKTRASTWCCGNFVIRTLRKTHFD